MSSSNRSTPPARHGRTSWLDEKLATHDIDRIQPNMGAAGDRVNQARRHVRSARALAQDDPTLAMAACHDAIRKAITGHMAANGYRPKTGDGAHRIVVQYAEHHLGEVIDVQDMENADAIRRSRSTAEYGDFAIRKVTSDQVRWAAGVADRIVDAIANDLAGTTRRAAPAKPASSG